MSRPSSSVPSRLTVPAGVRLIGGANRASRWTAFGFPCVTKPGAAAQTITAATTRPLARIGLMARKSRWRPRSRRGGAITIETAPLGTIRAPVPDPRIQDDVKQIDAEVEQHEHGRHHDHDRLDQRDVLADHRVDA